LAGELDPEAVTAAETAGVEPSDPGEAARDGRDLALRRRLRRALPSRRAAAAVLAPLAAAVAALWFVIPTIAPGVVSHAAGDSAEFQTVAWVMGTAHPTGYPSFTILGFLATHLLPFGDPAYRMNLLQALLAAGAVAGAVAIVQILTRMRWVALATGLLLLAMPTFVPLSSPYAGGSSTPVFWRLSTYADPHMFHLALTALIFVLLLAWERRRNSDDPDDKRHADRWLVAAAGVYGVAMTNHSLTLMLAPGIGLFVLAVAPRIFLQWRVVLTAGLVLIAAAGLLWLELPVRAAMHAALVYGHPDNLKGFLFVVMGKQFGGIPPTFGSDLDLKYAQVMSLLSSWLGPLSYLAILGIGTSIIRRPRYLLLSLPAAAMTATFAASYVNSDLERYFLVPAFVAFTLVGFGIADGLSLCAWIVEEARARFAPEMADAADTTGEAGPAGEDSRRPGRNSAGVALYAAEIALAIVMIVAGATVVPDRQHVADAAHPGGVSQANQTADLAAWVHAVLAPADRGGLPDNAVIESTWYGSTALWYGQKVEGLRPDVLIVDDSARKNDHIGGQGMVWQVFDTYLGRRPVYTYRPQGGCDGIVNLGTAFQMEPTPLNNVYHVVARLEPAVSLGSCDPYDPTIQ
jgi:hypothetical protein